MELRTVKTNLPVSFQAIHLRRIHHQSPEIAPPFTGDSQSRDEIPGLVQNIETSNGSDLKRVT
jgi:hypothetical protein